MTAINCIKSVKYLPILNANAELEKICGVQCFFEQHSDVVNLHLSNREKIEVKEEYGDWQTNFDLALNVCRLLKEKGINPKVILEPTCGKGNFILAALQVFDNIEEVYGIEIYKPYIEELKMQILQYYIDNKNRRKVKIYLYHQNIFDFDFTDIKQSLKGREILVLGNPPWVTNSKLGEINSNNLPQKNNFKKLGGLDAITGKSNFDIAEYICRQMIGFLAEENANIALLLKNSVIKNIVHGMQENNLMIRDLCQYSIDAKKEFDVSVAASLFHFSIGKPTKRCVVKDFYKNCIISEYGWVDNCFVSDSNSYQKYRHIDGKSQLVWWSGLKHDCSKVMELSFDGNQYINGLGEIVDIEDDMIYPLLKSSDIKGKVITYTRKYVIITQKSTSDDTELIKLRYPKAYKYLLAHAENLDNRGSRIYKGRPRFSIFGIGKYSFKPYKIVVSGLYKKPNFAIVSPIEGKSVMLDDTCYMIGLNSLTEARITQHILESKTVQAFVNSLIFTDAKRTITKDLLMRIDFIKALKEIPNNEFNESELNCYLSMLKANVKPKQSTLF